MRTKIYFGFLALLLGAAIQVHAQCSFTGLPASICDNDAAVTLTGSGAPDGDFSGPGVTNNANGTASFDPAAAGVGSKTVTYTLVDYNITSIAYAPSGGTGTSISLADNAVSGALPIGFNFDFYGNTYSNIYASSNGFVTFNATGGAGCCSGQLLPNTNAPNNLIAAAWEDLDPSGSGAPIINYFTTGSSPNRQLVVNFTNLPHGPAPGISNFVTTQIKLFETSNIIEIHTNTMSSDGGSHTMGLENVNGTRATVVSGRNSSNWSISSSEARQFSPVICQDSATVVVNPSPSTAMIGPDTTICPGDTGYLTVNINGGNGPFAVDITGIGSTSGYANGGQIPINPAVNTSYSLVSVTDANGCTAGSLMDTANVSISVPPTGAILTGDTSICSGETANLMVAVTGGTGPYSVFIDSGVTASGYNSGGNIGVNPTSTTTYTLLSVEDTYGCAGTGATGTATVTVNNGPNIVTLYGDSATCLGVATYLWVDIVGGVGPYTVEIDNGIGTVTNFSSGDSVSIAPFTTTTYNIISVTDANGCTSSTVGNSYTVNLNLAPTAAVLAGTTTLCAGDSATLTVNIVGGTPPYSIEIDNGVGVISNYQSGAAITVAPGSNTTYNLVSTADAIGCPAAAVSGTATISVVPLPALPVITQTGSMLTSPPASAYQWYFNGSQISGGNTQSTVATQTGYYQVQVFDANGCSNISDSLLVTPVGLEELFKGTLAIYPNPTNAVFNLDLTVPEATQVKVRVMNLMGEVLQKLDSGGKVQSFERKINLQPYPAGIYLVEIVMGEQRIVHKVEKF